MAVTLAVIGDVHGASSRLDAVLGAVRDARVAGILLVAVNFVVDWQLYRASKQKQKK